jgi:uncharacterized protein
MIFVDTGFFFALFSLKDSHHQRAIEAFQRFEGRNLAEALITTDQVVLETITLARMRVSHKLAVFMGERLYSGKIARIHSTTLDEHRAAFDYLRRYSDKSYSAFDCLSFVVMERLGIREALAIDEHFTHRFVAIPGPLPRAGR